LKDLSIVANELNVEFKMYLLPFDDDREGILENLLDNCVNDNFKFFDSCWNEMLECIKKSKYDKLNIPAQKGFLYSKIDLFKNYRIRNWDYKGATVYDYSDKNIWNMDPKSNKELKKLIDFINNNLFNITR
jgi:hypothetical protein